MFYVPMYVIHEIPLVLAPALQMSDQPKLFEKIRYLKRADVAGEEVEDAGCCGAADEEVLSREGCCRVEGGSITCGAVGQETSFGGSC